MLNVKYWRIFCDVIYLFALVFIVSVDRAYKEVSTKKILKIVYGSDFVIWLYLQKAMYRPCDIDLWPMKEFFFLSELIATLLVSCMNFRSISAFYMLNVAHVKNDVKWRPIVTKFGTVIENMSRTGLYDWHIF